MRNQFPCTFIFITNTIIDFFNNQIHLQNDDYQS